MQLGTECPASVLTVLWEQAGIISLGKTVARSLLAVVDVGLGAALGREGPPCPCLVGTPIAFSSNKVARVRASLHRANSGEGVWLFERATYRCPSWKRQCNRSALTYAAAPRF